MSKIVDDITGPFTPEGGGGGEGSGDILRFIYLFLFVEENSKKYVYNKGTAPPPRILIDVRSSSVEPFPIDIINKITILELSDML